MDADNLRPALLDAAGDWAQRRTGLKAGVLAANEAFASRGWWHPDYATVTRCIQQGATLSAPMLEYLKRFVQRDGLDDEPCSSVTSALAAFHRCLDRLDSQAEIREITARSRRGVRRLRAGNAKPAAKQQAEAPYIAVQRLLGLWHERFPALMTRLQQLSDEAAEKTAENMAAAVLGAGVDWEALSKRDQQRFAASHIRLATLGLAAPRADLSARYEEVSHAKLAGTGATRISNEELDKLDPKPEHRLRRERSRRTRREHGQGADHLTVR